MLVLGFRTMGCRARAVIDADDPLARAALGGVPGWLARRERTLSRFAPASALRRLNDRGFAESVHPVLWEAIDVALRAADATGGLVTPTILPALEAAGYDRSFERVPRERDEPVAAARPAPDWRAIERDATRRSVRLPLGVRLDLGGTAKGWCVDLAASRLGRTAPALVEVGGDIAVSGRRLEPWPIAVEDPRGAAEPLDVVLLRSGGIATSGTDARRWTRSGLEQHHVIDPRTGAPARTDVLTATVVAPCALDAEVAAKRLLLAGSVDGIAWIETRSEMAAIVVRRDGRVLRSRRLVDHVWRPAA